MKTLRKNSKKGFTLVEIIVVIVIIAILAAALTPAVMNAVNKANETADQADAKNLMTAGSMASLMKNSAGLVSSDDILEEIPGGSVGVTSWTVYFSGDGASATAVGCTVVGRANKSITVGTTTTHTVVVTGS